MRCYPWRRHSLFRSRLFLGMSGINRLMRRRDYSGAPQDYLTWVGQGARRSSRPTYYTHKFECLLASRAHPVSMSPFRSVSDKSTRPDAAVSPAAHTG